MDKKKALDNTLELIRRAKETFAGKEDGNQMK